MTMFNDYAEKYKVSIADAISDRDWPMTINECIKAFNDSTGRLPNEQEVQDMRPDNYGVVTKERLQHDMEALGWHSQHELSDYEMECLEAGILEDHAMEDPIIYQ